MSRRVLSPDEVFRLRNDLQAATLAALMDSRRWEPGDLAFQGGTCLHLAYGCPRFSEDLDFMVRGGLSLDALAGEVGRRLRLPAGMPGDLQVAVKRTPEGRNPHVFTVSVGGPEVVGSAKVKIELRQTDGALMDSLQVRVSTVRAASGLQAFVPVATLDEILADKVYALGARHRLKPRDVFDLSWMFDQPQPPALHSETLCARLSIYPRGDAATTAGRWLGSARARAGVLGRRETAALVAADLSRWLPSSWAMNDAHALTMLGVARRQLAQGIGIIQTYQDEALAGTGR
jgi:predicted nucleotidyltransferase component of viral defense system